jgi:hypothetical protein
MKPCFLFFLSVICTNIILTNSFAQNGGITNSLDTAALRKVIIKEEIAPYLKQSTAVDWESIEEKVRIKYGDVGLEAYYGERMYYSLNHDDKQMFGKYYALYFRTAYARSDYHINNASWAIFESISDPGILLIAAKTQRYNIDHISKNSPAEIDTYANLLYKLGRNKEAIKWEKRAIQMEAEVAPKENRSVNTEFGETLKKMKRNEHTWPY